MGSCLSASRTSNDGAEISSQASRRKRPSARSGPSKQKHDEIQSLVRVGSKVLQNVPNQSLTGRTHLEPVRASSYDHVHNLVLMNFEGSDVLKRKAGVVGLINLGKQCSSQSARFLSFVLHFLNACNGNRQYLLYEQLSAVP